MNYTFNALLKLYDHLGKLNLIQSGVSIYLFLIAEIGNMAIHEPLNCINLFQEVRNLQIQFINEEKEYYYSKHGFS